MTLKQNPKAEKVFIWCSVFTHRTKTRFSYFFNSRQHFELLLWGIWGLACWYHLVPWNRLLGSEYDFKRKEEGDKCSPSMGRWRSWIWLSASVLFSTYFPPSKWLTWPPGECSDRVEDSGTGHGASGGLGGKSRESEFEAWAKFWGWNWRKRQLVYKCLFHQKHRREKT